MASRSPAAPFDLPALGPGRAGRRSPCPAGSRPIGATGEAFLTVRVTTADASAVGAGRVRGLRPPAAGLGDATPRAARAGGTAPRRRHRRRSTTTAASSIRSWPRRRRSRCGAPRPTTTGSAGWPRAGRARAWTASSAVSSARRAWRRGDHVRGDVRRTAAGDRRSPHEATLHGPRRRRRSPSPRPSTSPRSWPTSARIGTVLEVVPGPESAALVRHRAARDLPGSQARPGSSAAGRRPSTDQYVPYIRPQENGGHADVRWLELARRRPVAASGSTSTHRARSP